MTNPWFKRLTAALIALGFCFAAAQPAQAQEANDADADEADVPEVMEMDVVDVPAGDRPTGLNQGDWTLSFGTNLVHDVISRTDNLTTFTLSARIAHNVTPELRVGGVTELLVLDSDSTAHRFQIAGRATYHFAIDDQYLLVPYVGGGVGLTSLDLGPDEFGPSLHAVGGVEYYIRGDGVFRNTSVFLEYTPDVVFYGGAFGTTFRNTLLTGISLHW